jgi:hypothetical protein
LISPPHTTLIPRPPPPRQGSAARRMNHSAGMMTHSRPVRIPASLNDIQPPTRVHVGEKEMLTGKAGLAGNYCGKGGGGEASSGLAIAHCSRQGHPPDLCHCAPSTSVAGCRSVSVTCIVTSSRVGCISSVPSSVRETACNGQLAFGPIFSGSRILRRGGGEMLAPGPPINRQQLPPFGGRWQRTSA